MLGVEKRTTSKLLLQDRCVRSCDGARRLCAAHLASAPISVEKILEIDSHVGVAMSGLVADSNTLVEHARVEGQNHRFTYDEAIPVSSLTQSICDLKMRFGEGGQSDADDKPKMVRVCFVSRVFAGTLLTLALPQSRPFGVSLLIAGCDDKGPQL